MQFRTHYPKNRLLADHIAYFYYIKSDQARFQHYLLCFSAYLQWTFYLQVAGYHVTSNSLTTYSDTLNNHQAFLQSRYQFPLKITLNGPIDKVTIVFKPLGINHFIDTHFADITQELSQPFNQWQGNDYQKILNQFLQPMILI